jgi:hypothetical protein
MEKNPVQQVGTHAHTNAHTLRTNLPLLPCPSPSLRLRHISTARYASLSLLSLLSLLAISLPTATYASKLPSWANAMAALKELSVGSTLTSACSSSATEGIGTRHRNRDKRETRRQRYNKAGRGSCYPAATAVRFARAAESAGSGP